MNELLVKTVFDKTYKELGTHTPRERICAYLENYTTNELNNPIARSSFIRWHEYLENKEKNIPLKPLKINGSGTDILSQILGFKNFSDFIENQKEEQTDTKIKGVNLTDIVF